VGFLNRRRPNRRAVRPNVKEDADVERRMYVKNGPKSQLKNVPISLYADCVESEAKKHDYVYRGGGHSRRGAKVGGDRKRTTKKLHESRRKALQTPGLALLRGKAAGGEGKHFGRTVIETNPH